MELGVLRDNFSSKIYLDLHCKVEKDWRNKDFFLRNFGYKE